MANGAGRLFNIIKNTSEGTNLNPSQVISLTVKSLNPLILNRDDKLDITEDFCVFSDLVNKSNLEIDDILIAFVFNDGQSYFIQQVENKNSLNYNNLSNKPKINNVELIGNKTLIELGIKDLIEECILADNKLKYPVGKIIMETENVNPETYLGFGTWELWGAGRVPVGVDTTDENFEQAELTGGSKTHQHNPGDMSACIGSASGNADSLGFAATNGQRGPDSTYSVGGTTHTASGHPKRSHNTVLTGKTEEASSFQPYITCYMWKRIL